MAQHKLEPKTKPTTAHQEPKPEAAATSHIAPNEPATEGHTPHRTQTHNNHDKR